MSTTSSLPTSKEQYDLLLPLIEALPDSARLRRNLSTAHIVGEATQLAHRAQKDRAHFAEIPAFDLDLIDSLNHRIGAFALAQAHYTNSKGLLNATHQQWLSVKEEVKGHKKRLVTLLRFIYTSHHETHKLSILSPLSRTGGLRKSTEDFLRLTEMVAHEEVRLRAMGYSNEEFTRTQELFSLLKKLLGEELKAGGDHRALQTAENKILADKAYYYLHVAVQEIRSYGQFIFASDPAQVRRYTSEIHRKAGSKKKPRKPLEKSAKAVGPEELV